MTSPVVNARMAHANVNQTSLLISQNEENARLRDEGLIISVCKLGPLSAHQFDGNCMSAQQVHSLGVGYDLIIHHALFF